jgi:hypothetical protein
LHYRVDPLGSFTIGNNPFEDQRSFDYWREGELPVLPSHSFTTLSRDVRACTVSAIDWLLSRDERDPEPSPHWDKGRRELRFRGILCRKSKKLGSNQGSVLDAFQASGWPASIMDPLKNAGTLRQTMKDIQKGMHPGAPLRSFVESIWLPSLRAFRTAP